MKTKLTLLLLISSLSIFAQETLDTSQVKDSILSNEDFKKIIHTSFSKLITGQKSNTIGSYASLDIEKTEMNFSPTFLLKNGSIITGKISGGITDGISSLFQNSKFNTNIGAELQFHFLGSKNARKAQYYAKDLKTRLENKKKINDDYQNELDKIESKYQVNTAKVDNEKLTQENEKLKKEIDSLSLLNKPLEDDLIKAKISLKKLKIKQNEFKKNENLILIKNFNEDIEKLKINNIRAQKLEENDIKNLKIVGYTLSWFSLAYKIKNDNFKLVNQDEIYENQIKTENYLSHEFKSQYTYVKVDDSNQKNIYFNTSLSFNLKNNISALDKIDVKESNILGTSLVQTREYATNYIAYNGIYRSNIKQISLDFDYYHFILNNKIGLHLFPNSKFTDKTKPIYNVGVGLVAPFMDKEKEKSVVNVELYYNIVNVFNSKDSSYTILQRNDIGLRFSFPLNFNNPNL
jgi:hypothetical protein